MAINYGTAEAANVPITEQSFGAQRPPEAQSLHAPVPASTYVPGVGNLGPDLGGYVKGDMLRQQYRMNEHEDARAEEKLGMEKVKTQQSQDYLKIAQSDLGIRQADLSMRQDTHGNDMEKFGWERDAHLKEKVIQDGMTQAATDGGYEGVIDYLKNVDPARAITFHAEKLKLDQSILSTDVMKAVAPNEINNATLEAYGVIGKMGQAILQAKPEDRENMFKAMTPMMKQVMGDNVPKTLEEAVPVYMLAVAQVTPQNQLFKSTNTAVQMQSAVGKLDADINAKLKAGFTSDNDPGLKDMMAAREVYSARNQNAILSKTATELQIASSAQNIGSSKLTNTMKLQSNLNTSSKDYLKFMDDYTGISGALKTLEKDPTNSVAQGTVSTMMASAVQKGVLTDPDYERVAKSNAGFTKMLQNYGTQWATGKVVVLAPKEIANLKQVFDDVSQSKVARQKVLEKNFQDKTSGYGDILSKDNIQFPSVQYDTLEQQKNYGRIIDKYELNKYPPEIQQQAAEAIDKGVDPAAIHQFIQKNMTNKGAPTNAGQQ